MLKFSLSTSKKSTQPMICIAQQGNLSSKHILTSAPINEVLKNFQNKRNSLTFQEILNQDAHTVIFNQKPQIGLDHDEQIRCVAYEMGNHYQKSTEKSIAVYLDAWKPEQITAFMQGLYYSSYSFLEYKSQKNIQNLSVTLIINSSHKQELETSLKNNKILFAEIEQCRNFINTPGSDLTPEVFAKTAQKLAKEAGVSIKTRKASQLKKEGFQGLITVGKGSLNEPYMITLNYQGTKTKKNQDHLVLVGKGVTFDTGGISLKPGDGMWEMKSDMSGAATVLATILTAAKQKLPIQLTAILCLAENRPDGIAALPGDIFKAKNGKTIMVDNTDAEGRLILSDGLAEAGLVKATHIIDLATLTGSIVRAIGPSMAGIFSNTSSWSDSIVKSGLSVGEKLWPMPLEMEYQEQLKDPVADLRNIGSINAGSVTAALFLNEFVPENTQWAHIDIAGTAFTSKPWKYYPSGMATGWGVKTLVQLITKFA